MPSVALSIPLTGQDVQIGADFSFTATFDNTDLADTGYGPFIDLYFPATGGDGDGDGVTFVSADYLGTSVNATVLTFDALGNATHPYQKGSSGSLVTTTGTPGDQLVVLELPFGSFVPTQPPVDVTIPALLSNRADGGTHAQISRAPISSPAAFGCTTARLSTVSVRVLI